MGEVEVLVGCPHRLSAPISWRTKYPCPLCRDAGFPGLWAIALTVDYRPRRRGLADAAVSTLLVTGIPPAPPRPVHDFRTIAQAMTEALRSNHHARGLVDSLVIEQSVPQMVVQPQTPADVAAEVVRMQFTQQFRLRHRR